MKTTSTSRPSSSATRPTYVEVLAALNWLSVLGFEVYCVEGDVKLRFPRSFEPLQAWYWLQVLKGAPKEMYLQHLPVGPRTYSPYGTLLYCLDCRQVTLHRRNDAGFWECLRCREKEV
ncbi:hypothetical protein Adeg_0413 [Ammonifex degensii KC4]|uniref:Uncharacterized protein n=1 Tax=Ammonifex degensii (strain DSM 10501 / KC4) TaxID=429009 RepID=C9RBD9_AMMDK|nr:hypothetical protein [Ammonifex degensii]ACX51566.1 hypothetical protein Adeg_0413 [Ammonifex degensii KC4]